MAEKVPKNLAILAALLSEPNADFFNKIDVDNMALGEFVKAYTSTPATVDFSNRSSIREDTVMAELSGLLLNNPETEISVMDACCGVGNLAKRIIQSMGEKIGHISYLAIDEHPASIRTIRSQVSEFDGFKSFNIIQRQISDLEGVQSGSIDLLVLNNALHELPPRLFPRMFSVFNSLIHPDRGLMCIVDMEELPQDQPESIAITWKGNEVEEFLRAGGLPAVVTVHPKLTMVYHAQVKHEKAGVEEVKMLDQIRVLLKSKLREAILSRQRLEASQFSTSSELKEWVVLSGTIARCSEELLAIN